MFFESKPSVTHTRRSEPSINCNTLISSFPVYITFLPIIVINIHKLYAFVPEMIQSINIYIISYVM